MIDPHYVYFGEKHFTIRHSMECYTENRTNPLGMAVCPFHIWCDSHLTPPAEIGDYVMSMEDGMVVLHSLGLDQRRDDGTH